MSGRPDIFLADAFEGLSRLRVHDPRVAGEVLRMLSLDRLEASPAAPLDGAFSPAANRPARPPETMPPATSAPTPSLADPPAFTGRVDTTLRRLRGQSLHSAPPAWLAGVTSVARSSAPTPAMPMPEPIFPRSQMRALLTSALSTLHEDGPLDVARVVETLARQEPLRELPFEVTSTIRRGAQLLIDTGMRMAPFQMDVDHLVARIESIVADDQVQVYYFSGCPSRDCVRRGSAEMRPWTAPARGTPVFMVTDLGIGAPQASDPPADVDEWLGFALRVRTSGCRLSALVPYGPRRWPRRLARAMVVIHWDRRTTAAVVRRGMMNATRVAR